MSNPPFNNGISEKNVRSLSHKKALEKANINQECFVLDISRPPPLHPTFIRTYKPMRQILKIFHIYFLKSSSVTTELKQYDRSFDIQKSNK